MLYFFWGGGRKNNRILYMTGQTHFITWRHYLGRITSATSFPSTTVNSKRYVRTNKRWQRISINKQTVIS
jgi:hypothetical protein